MHKAGFNEYRFRAGSHSATGAPVTAGDRVQALVIILLAVITVAMISLNARHQYLSTRPGPQLVFVNKGEGAAEAGRLILTVDTIAYGSQKVPYQRRAVTVPISDLAITGWSVDAASRAPALGVAAAIDGSLPFSIDYGAPRPDVAKALNRACEASGFVLSVRKTLLAPGEHRIIFRSFSTDGKGYTDSPAIRIIVKG
jgi:hypothetical protein